MAAALRRDIAYGHIPPGARLPGDEYADRYHVSRIRARKVLAALDAEGMARTYSYYHYATPAGQPDPAVGGRLGVTLTRLREATGREPADLATRRWPVQYVTEAEKGTWLPRDFWAAMDAGLGADGTLLRIHDNYYAGPVSAAPDPGLPDPGPPPPARRDPDAEAAVIAGVIDARITAGAWPPGTALPSQKTLADEHAAPVTVVSLALRQLAGKGRLISVPFGGGRSAYLVPGAGDPAPAAVPALSAVILVWGDGTRTRLSCTLSGMPP
jgi:DNA-binding transcriptional regulator YhcF (GntR family)